MTAPRLSLTQQSTPLSGRACHAKTQQLFARLLLPSIMSALGLLATAVHAEPVRTKQECNGPIWTPDSRFELKGGEAYDKQTKLTWKRCSEGMRWDGSNCSGTAEQYSWNDAIKHFPAGGNDWRLPNTDELASIRAGYDNYGSPPKDPSKMPGVSGCVEPALNQSIFIDAKNNRNWFFWSSSIYAPDLAYAWYANFNRGSDNGVNKSNHYYVRLVRGKQHLGPLTKAGDAISLSEFRQREKRAETEARQRETNRPKTGSCVQVTFTGRGLLNSGQRVTMRGRVTSEGGSYAFLKIVSIRGDDSIFWDGKEYYQGDEIEFATKNLQRCD